MKFGIIIVFFLTMNVRAENKKSLEFSAKNWTTVAYKKIKPNTVKFENNSMIVEVNSSASPLVYKLSTPQSVTGFRVVGELTGFKKTESGKFDEDSVLRVGLVTVGKNKLTGIKKMIAADWVKRLFALAPEGTGLDKIYFYNFSDRAELVKKNRLHPKSDLIDETVITAVRLGKSQQDKKYESTTVKYEHQYSLAAPKVTAALWLSIDGDDTKSQYTNLIKTIELFW